MQRLFSMFPQGGPGIALLLLRFSVTGVFLFRFWAHLASTVPQWIFFVVCLFSLSLCVGLFTPLLAVLVCLIGIYSLIHTGVGTALINLCATLDAGALALLGPGAYSVDALLYGRRVVVVPASKPPQR